MTVATITAKGQVTVPKQVRMILGLNPGDKIDFQVNDDGSITIKPCKKSIAQIKGIIKTDIKLTVDEMNDAIVDYHESNK